MLPLIHRDDLKARMDAGTVVVVDTMPRSYYESEHLPGARNIPGFPYEHAARCTDELAPTVLPDLSASIVVYCSNSLCRNSEFVGNRLLQLGYSEVRKYREGIQDWAESGFPTVRADSADIGA